MRTLLIVLCLLFGSLTPALAQVSVGISLPSVSIGINVPTYPTLVRVPGYPCYYAPNVAANYFFYDGMYWVYVGDSWYSAYWYNGPWALVAPEVVPLFVLRIPVRYYRAPPVYFASWRRDAPPRWGEHWGGGWAQRRAGWDRWDRRSVAAAAPLPVYQRRYAGNRYPQVEQQRVMVSQSYRHQPRDAVVRQHFQEHVVQKAAARSERKQERIARQEVQRASPPPERRSEEVRKSAPAKAAPQQRDRDDLDKGRQAKGGAPEPRRDRGEEKARDRGEDKGRGDAKGRAEEKGREKGGERGHGKD
jgi:hypothetical protein